MKQSSFKWIEQAEQAIRDGKGLEVRKRLLVLKNKGVPPSQILPIAKLACRVGLYHFATNILFRHLSDFHREATQEEKLVYANSLAGSGNYIGAQKIFSQIPEENLKEHLNTYVDTLFRNWDYKKGLSLLKRYAPQEYTSYADLVYGLNFSSALLECEEYNLAETNLYQIFELAQSNNHKMITANCKEMLGQIFFHQKNYEMALPLFTESEQILRESNNISWIFSLRWLALTRLALLQDKNSLDELTRVRKETRKFCYWEGLRSCDLYEAIFTANASLFSRCYYGTPHEHFRAKAKKLWGSSYFSNEILIGPQNKTCAHQFEIESMKMKNEQEPLVNTELSRKLMFSLMQDKYRPLSTFQIFHTLYPEEFFNPITSKQKTYKIIKKLKSELQDHPVGFSITSLRNYGYRLRVEKPLKLIYPQTITASYSKSNQFLQMVQKQVGSSPFDRSQFCEITFLKERTGNRILKELEASGLIEKSGKGRGIRYKIVA